MAAASLNATERILPFLQWSIAMWLAMPALPPLPMNITLLPASCASRKCWTMEKNASFSGISAPDALVTSASRQQRSSCAKYPVTRSTEIIPAPYALFQQGMNGFDNVHFLNRPLVAYDIHLQRTDDIPDETSHVDGTACRHHRGYDAKKRV